jgi:CopG antitoxin of type II toxin-antitoxin system
MNVKKPRLPKFKSEGEEADWWASAAGRAYVKARSAEARARGTKSRGSSLVAKLNRKSTTQIALRLPETDIAQARSIADRKGIGYQTLLKILVREARRK